MTQAPRILRAAALVAAFGASRADTLVVQVAPAPGGPTARPAVLLAENFNEENGGWYQLNYTGFARWTVTRGTVDLVGTPPFDDFLPAAQGMYVDLDGTSNAAGVLETTRTLELAPGRYRLSFKLAGTPRPNQPPNTVTVSLGGAFRETFTLESYAPLRTITREITIQRKTHGKLRFAHAGGDNYGIFLDDILLRRL